MQYKQGCVIPIGHIISTNEDAQYKHLKHSKSLCYPLEAL